MKLLIITNIYNTVRNLLYILVKLILTKLEAIHKCGDDRWSRVVTECLLRDEEVLGDQQPDG